MRQSHHGTKICRKQRRSQNGGSTKQRNLCYNSSFWTDFCSDMSVFPVAVQFAGWFFSDHFNNYSSTDEDVMLQKMRRSKALEETLNTQINQIESRHPDYDEYRYQLMRSDTIHISLFLIWQWNMAVYLCGSRRWDKEIFQQQYGINTQSTRNHVETKTVQVGDHWDRLLQGYCCSICWWSVERADRKSEQYRKSRLP